jgi:hypothetical protein
MILDDGTGSGNKAKVDDDKRLLVYAKTEPVEAVASEEGNSFIIHAECHTAASAGGGLLYVMNNETDYDLDITRIFIDGHTITPTDLICMQIFDATISNGTDVSSTAIINKNRGSANSFNLTVKISDGSSDMTYTGGTKYHSYPIKTMVSNFRDMAGTNIIPRNKSILFAFKRVSGGNATDGEIISISMNIVRYKNK